MTARKMFIVALLALAGCDQASRETGTRNYDVIQSGKVGDGRYATYIMIVRDRATGCEYLASGYQDLAMTPRMAADGKQICRGAA